MTASIIPFPPRPGQPPTVEEVLTEALAQGYTEVVVIGTRPDGTIGAGTNTDDGGSILWLLKVAEMRLMLEGQG